MIKYIACFNISAKNFLRNRFQLIGRLIFYILTIQIFSQLWHAAYDAEKIMQFNVSDMIWYIAITEWGVLSEPYIYTHIQNDIKNGNISYFLLRPISYVSMRIFEGLGTYFPNLFFFGIVGIVTASSLSGNILHGSYFLVIAFVLCILSGILSFLFQVIIGLCAFWFQEVGSIGFLYRKFMYLFGGLLLPLSIYPEWMKTLAYLTPFPWMIYHRTQIIYSLSSRDALNTFLILLIWILVAYVILSIFFRLCLRRLSINGG